MRKLILLSVLTLLGTRNLHAGWLLVPDSHHQQFQTYAFLTEEQTALIWRDAGKAFAQVGGYFTALENNEWRFRPQLVIFGNVLFSWRPKDMIFEYGTETFDARFGFALEGHITDSLRVSLGFLHSSGHASDGVLDPDLYPPDLGDEQIVVRGIYDWNKRVRVGLSLKPMVVTSPKAQFFAADQFVEWFPWGITTERNGYNPFISVGLEEGGVDNVELTTTIQIGVSLRDHMRSERVADLRIVVGYYNGADARLKYAQIKRRRSETGFAGFVLSL